MVYLATLEQVRQEVTNVKPADTPSLLRALAHASARLEAKKRTYFEPRYETRYFDATVEPVSPDGRVLMLPDILLADLISVTLGDGTEVALTDVRAAPRGQTPIRELVLTAGQSWLHHSGTPEQAIAVEGVWVWRTEYDRMAWDTITTITASSALDATTVAIASHIAAFSPGLLIRIGAEYLRVMDVNSDDNLLTVERGLNGTTAAAHAEDALIDAFRPEDVVNRAAQRWAGYLHAWHGSFAKSTYDGQSYISFPQDMPAEIANTLNELKTRRTAYGG